jgi:hypothetical protein
MGELKPIGSEKLTGDAKMKRILELTYYQSSNESVKSAEIVKEAKTGVYGIVKEKDGYYVKKGLNEKSLDYIGGLFMKNKNKFSSYGEAYKKLEFLTEQEEIQEATKYVLKQPKPAPLPQEEAPAPVATGEAPPPTATPDPTTMDSADAGIPPAGDETGMEDPNAAPAGEEDYLKVIQKLTGKLTQKLRGFEDKLESNDIKYVLNMVIASVDLEKLDEGDKEEVLEKFEPQEDDGSLEPEAPTGDETPAPEDEMGETQVDGMDALEELINTPFEEKESVFDDDDDEGSHGFNDDDINFLNSPEAKSPKASKFAEKDIEKELAGMDDEDDDMDSPLDPEKDDYRPEEGDDEEDIDEVKELDIDELTNMVNNTVKDSLSKYFS